MASKAAMSQMVVLKNFGKVDELDVVDCLAVPEPGAGQLVIEIKYCGMNFADIYTRFGLFRTSTTPKPPFTMGREAAGEVVSVGQGVTYLKPGNRVACISSKLGLWTSYALVESSDVILLPDEMSYEHGAAFFINYVTAFSALFGFGSLRKGQKVFIHSIGGGVGCAAVQLAKTIPGTVILGTSSPGKHEKLKDMKIDFLFDSQNSDYVEKVLEQFPEGVDLILDNRSGKEFQAARKMLAPLGKIVHIGANSVFQGESWSWMSMIKTFWAVRSVSLFDLISFNHAVCGLNIDELKIKAPNKYKQICEELISMYNEQKIKPCIDSTWNFQEVRIATCRLLARENIGKILLKPN